MLTNKSTIDRSKLCAALFVVTVACGAPVLLAAGERPPLADGLAVSALDPLALTDAMRTWSALHLGSHASPSRRARTLLAKLTRPGPHGVVEIASPTPTAAEAFAIRRADCVGFALLFVALARAAALDAGFALIAAPAEIEQQGALRIERNHLVATAAGRVFDLGGESALDLARHRPIADRTALALFFSNRGAQALAAGDPPAAVDLLYTALRFDPSLTWVWSNLGVGLRRAGDREGAVLAHQMAARLAPFDRGVRRNLEIALGDR